MVVTQTIVIANLMLVLWSRILVTVDVRRVTFVLSDCSRN